jgi:3' terminal RNA ribose 2'-O-methyltransferase Hen1
MQVEITLQAPEDAGYSARDLGFLLHKHPDHVHERETAAGRATIFFTSASAHECTAVLFLDIDPVGLVRGRGPQGEGLLAHYVNDRPYVANSFLSVAISRSFGQSMAGKSKERQHLANEELPFKARICPVAAAGGEEVIKALFEPLGYQTQVKALDTGNDTTLFDLRLAADVHLKDLLNHLYVLVPVLDNAKHYWIDRDEIDNLLAKGEGWLAGHPARELIARRALKHRRSLANQALERLAEGGEPLNEAEDRQAPPEPEADLEKPIRLHDLRLDTVLKTLVDHGARTVLDLGCGEGRLIARLIRQRGIERIVGVDASVRTIEMAVSRLHLDRAGEALRERVSLRLGSLTYGDRDWRNFDAATLVEVIEHIDPPRLSALELSLFGDARPGLIIITTPNREYNALFEGLPAGKLRHGDHRFE